MAKRGQSGGGGSSIFKGGKRLAKKTKNRTAKRNAKEAEHRQKMAAQGHANAKAKARH